MSQTQWNRPACVHQPASILLSRLSISNPRGGSDGRREAAAATRETRTERLYNAHQRLASEFAREQGWDTNEEQRAQRPAEKQPYDGGRDYDYGARDFGDTAEDTSSAQPQGELRKAMEKLKKGSERE